MSTADKPRIKRGHESFHSSSDDGMLCSIHIASNRAANTINSIIIHVFVAVSTRFHGSARRVDDKPVAEYKLSSGAVLHLVLALRG